MRIRVLPILLLLVLTGLFALINWTTFSTPTTLNFGVATMTVPLGLIMLGVITVIGIMYVASVVYLQGSAMLDARRLGRELQAQSDLADNAEASRFTELRDFMSAELLRVTHASDEMRSTLLSRLEQMEQRHRLAIEQASNTLSAYIGQMENRLEDHRVLPPDGGIRHDDDYGRVR
ncbi:MAG TPA: LapA family protein [Burkholderiaceae bacterium]|nr:LapA family protein [Burkholderiaceae bacterium]